MRGLLLTALVVGGVALAGCKKKKEAPIDVTPPSGAASTDELSIGIGQARGLSEDLASTSTRWRHVITIDATRAIVTGELATEIVAIVTDDAGKSWRALRHEHEAWAGWSVGADGTVVLAAGARDGATAASGGTVESAHLLFATLDTPNFTTPTSLFPQAKGPAKGLLQGNGAVPALLGPDIAALIADEGPRSRVIFYGGKPGVDPVPRLSLPAAEKFVTTPLGRPPMLLSTKGRDLFTRPFPEPGKALDKPQKFAGVVVTPTLVAELSAVPACETGEWSFQRIKQPRGQVHLIGVSPNKLIRFPLPEATLKDTSIGCGAGRIVVQTANPKTRSVELTTCDLDGNCKAPVTDPFRDWLEPHEHEIQSAGLDNGVVGVLSDHMGARWGLFLAASADGITYERPRVIGEGTGDRGRVELGALVPFGKRVVLLVSADVTGTSRRGWFAIASEDAGINWSPP